MSATLGELNFPEPNDASAHAIGLVEGEDDAPKDIAEYEERVVAFIDILGFSDLVRASEHDVSGEQLRLLSQALDISPQLADALKSPTQSDAPLANARIHTFSDFVVVSHEKSAVGFAVVLFLSWLIAKDWLSKGFLPRGGIAVGKLVHRTHNGHTSGAPMVFGPAFLHAYGVESGIADVARIALHVSARKYRTEILSETTLKGVRLGSVKSLAFKCPDGPWAIDIFSHLRKNGFQLKNDGQRTEAEQFAQQLQVRLERDADNPQHYKKAHWLAQQFNNAIVETQYADLRLTFD